MEPSNEKNQYLNAIVALLAEKNAQMGTSSKQENLSQNLKDLLACDEIEMAENLYQFTPEIMHTLLKRSDLMGRVSEKVQNQYAKSNRDYAQCIDRLDEILEKYCFVYDTFYEDGLIELTENQHEIVLEYLQLLEIEQVLFQEALYFQGHQDCLQYLKKTGLL